MKTRNKIIPLTLILAVLALAFGKKIWPPSDVLHPSSQQLPFFIFLSVVEAIIFGLGVSFFVFIRPKMKTISVSYRKQSWAVFLSLTWMLISWWPHDNLHAHIGVDVPKLLLIEYVFHLTLMIAAIIVSWGFVSLLKNITQNE